jgi:hypothetical protein
VLRVLRKRLVRLPTVDPAPDQVAAPLAYTASGLAKCKRCGSGAPPCAAAEQLRQRLVMTSSAALHAAAAAAPVLLLTVDAVYMSGEVHLWL